MGPFVEITKGAKIGDNTRVSSHSFICSLVTIGKNCFIGHGVMFTNDLFKNGEIIKSPMVGTYYSKPSPEDAPFATVGQKVKKGETLCLIEVMKLFTSVEATKDGIVTAIFAEDGALVEFDQPLFSIS